MKISYVWFDIGYTLLYMQREITYQQVLKEYGAEVSLEKLEKYFHLTDKLFMREYPGVSGVRVITVTGSRNAEVARAFLHRDSLNELTWRRARTIAGKARTEGTQRPVLLEDLVEWGQDHTEFGYSEEFVG
ncbi:MAG: hypothetical protein V3S05_04015 [Desulfobacterales bacterium]